MEPQIREAHKHAISDKESAICKHLRTCEHLIFIQNLCNLPDTLNSDNGPPAPNCNKEYFIQLVRNNTTVLDCNSSYRNITLSNLVLSFVV